MRRIVIRFCFAVLAMALAGPVCAGDDATQDFSMRGTLKSGAKVDGILIVDLAKGQAVAAKIFVIGRQTDVFTHIFGQKSFGYSYVITVTTAENPSGCPYLIFGERDKPANLQHYRGGALGVRTFVGYCDGSSDTIASGRLRPAY
jgi:hypothetical protein